MADPIMPQAPCHWQVSLDLNGRKHSLGMVHLDQHGFLSTSANNGGKDNPQLLRVMEDFNQRTCLHLLLRFP